MCLGAEDKEFPELAAEHAVLQLLVSHSVHIWLQTINVCCRTSPILGLSGNTASYCQLFGHPGAIPNIAGPARSLFCLPSLRQPHGM